MLSSTEAIVFKSSGYSEADLIVTLFTLDFGLVKVFAKSPRKLKSRFGSSLEPLTYSKVSFWGKESAPLPRLTQSDILKPYQSLREELGCFLMLSEAAELVIDFMPVHVADPKVFSLLRWTLEAMERQCARLNVLLFKTRFLEHKGYAPRLDACGRCGGPGHMFYPSQGSVICGGCISRLGLSSATAVVVSQGAASIYGALRTWEPSKTSRIRASDALLSELSSVLDSHVEHILSRPLRTRTFSNRLKGA